MNRSDFLKNQQNPLTELSELRLELEQDDEDFKLICQLRFGVMSYHFKGREYEIGVTRARLQLALEGCETKLGRDFGDNNLSPVEERSSIETDISVSGTLGVQVDGHFGPKGGGSAKAGAGALRRSERSQMKSHLPVKALPNSGWDIKPESVSGTSKEWIDGTAIAGHCLCELKRKDGGNRISLTGDLQVRNTSIKVIAKGGNSLGKMFSMRQNQDTIVGIILAKALKREAASVGYPGSNHTVVISRSEIAEN